MDAGVLSLRIFPHEADPYRPMVLAPGERIVPSLTADGPVVRPAAVSLIIPTFRNRSLKSRSLRYLLDGIERSAAVAEVVLVEADGGGDAESSVPIRPGGKPLARVACPPNRRGQARNIGAAAAACDLLLFLDDDMLPRDWRAVDVIAARLQERGDDCALFPRRQYARFPLLYDATALEAVVARWRAGELDPDDPRVLDPVVRGAPYKTMTFCFPGCFMLIGRAAFERVGGFPTEYDGWGFEDAAFALRAVDRLKVLNLFRRADPLLHIDHPVSPYKTEEYVNNYRRFSASYDALDMDGLCRQVFAGADFAGAGGRTSRTDEYLRPLIAVAEAYHLPWPREEVRRNYEQVLRLRLDQGLDPVPRHVVLHGSRGGGTAGRDSDFDLLVLFRGGGASEYFVARRDGAPPVELEYAGRRSFEQVAAQPAHHPLRGPLELAKIARGVVLWGDAPEWTAWSDELLRMAVRHGRAVWLLYALGLALNGAKLGAWHGRYLAAVQAVLARVDEGVYRRDIELLDGAAPEALGVHVGAVLDAEVPGWKADLNAGRRVFAAQVPELWTALRWAKG